MRLDIYLVLNNLANTRNRAKEMILANMITVNNNIINKCNYIVKDNDIVNVITEFKYVSRAGYKLQKAIEEFSIDFTEKTVLDIGSSTGGFVDCALRYKAKKVYALDVGENQLHSSLLNNSKVINLENTNLKQIPNLEFDTLDIITSDVSFISLSHVFSNIKSIVNKDTIIIALIKPQFETNNSSLVIKSIKQRQIAINNVIKYAKQNGFKLINLTESPIKGAKLKNIEYLSLFRLDTNHHE